MKRLAVWLWEHWWLAALAVGLGIAVLWSRNLSPKELAARLKLELDAIQAKGEARTAQAQLGAEKAREMVEETYRSEIIALDAEQKRKADELRHDPVALAQFLVMAGGASRVGERKTPF